LPTAIHPWLVGQVARTTPSGTPGIGHRDWDWDDDVRLTSVVVTVVIRDGLAVTRASEYAVPSVLRYANDLFQALRGELVIVTPHGWISSPDQARLRPSDRRAAGPGHRGDWAEGRAAADLARLDSHRPIAG
jgi:hypothetical protein